MCLIIAIVIYILSYNFYMHDSLFQAFMSALLASLMLGFFTYKIIKNRRCFFGNDKDCNQSKKE
ncbi:MAG: hypothetical protein Q9M40_10735 [Sulfurimonas sp.]|nr:hypothetical protein [Sulfurimonas sp.]